MPVYVDDMDAPFGRMLMSHLIADTTEELLEMVDIIGVQRKWIQRPGTEHEHFDISKSKKALALENGAVAITWLQCSCMTRRRLETGKLGDPKTAEDYVRRKHGKS